MLKSIDVLIGLTVIMLALSMAVTVMTQFLTTVINSRGQYLKRGLIDLLSQIDPGLDKKVAGAVAKAVLKNPLVNATWGRLGSVVHREEFTKLLLHLATRNGDGQLDAGARDALKAALKNNGIEDPDAVLKNIRTAALQLESLNPELPASVRQSLAVLQEAKTDLVAKVNGWFDQTMDRVAQRFTAQTRTIVFVAAVLVAGTLQVDTILLVNRLSADDKLRDAFVARAKTMQPSAGTGSAAAAEDEKIDREYLAFLADHGLITVPRNVEEWKRHWNDVSPFGVVTTALLLSLGAPFWYNALRRLLQLRSALAEKEEQQRAARQGVESRADTDRPDKARVPGERGNLAAVG
jgi:hypothetical protein